MEPGIHKISIKLIIFILLIILLNFITIFFDANKIDDDFIIGDNFIEKIGEDKYLLFFPLMFNDISVNDISKLDIKTSVFSSCFNFAFSNFLIESMEKKQILFSVEDIKSSKKIFVLIKNDKKEIDKIIHASLYYYNNNYFLIDVEIKQDLTFKKLLNSLKFNFNDSILDSIFIENDLIEQKKLNLITKNLFFKAHFIDEGKENPNILKNKDELKLRVLRAIKERSCLIIINKSKIRFDDSIKNEILKKSIFVNSLKSKRLAYLIIGFLAVIINLFLFLIFYKKQNKIFSILFIINSIILSLSYIFFIFFDFNNFNFNFSPLILFLQISTYLLNIYQFSSFLFFNKNEIKLPNFYKIILLYSLIFTLGIIINTLFFLNSLLWLKPEQNLTYFFYFFPALFILFGIKKRQKINFFYQIIFFIFFLILLYILFKLKDYGFLNTSFEINFRNFLESNLPIRFRTREFFFYTLIINFFILKNLLRKNKFLATTYSKINLLINLVKNKFILILYYILFFPFLTILNSYYHSYTPLYLSFLRTILAIFFGFISSILLFVIEYLFYIFPVGLKLIKNK